MVPKNHVSPIVAFVTSQNNNCQTNKIPLGESLWITATLRKTEGRRGDRDPPLRFSMCLPWKKGTNHLLMLWKTAACVLPTCLKLCSFYRFSKGPIQLQSSQTKINLLVPLNQAYKMQPLFLYLYLKPFTSTAMIHGSRLSCVITFKDRRCVRMLGCFEGLSRTWNRHTKITNQVSFACTHKTSTGKVYLIKCPVSVRECEKKICRY